jgi:hypothetical protein
MVFFSPVADMTALQADFCHSSTLSHNGPNLGSKALGFYNLAFPSLFKHWFSSAPHLAQTRVVGTEREREREKYDA